MSGRVRFMAEGNIRTGVRGFNQGLRFISGLWGPPGLFLGTGTLLRTDRALPGFG